MAYLNAADQFPTAGNCKPKAMGGAGITSMTIEIFNSAGTCVPMVLQVYKVGGGPSMGVYNIICGARPQFLPCIEGGVLLTATSLPADTYTIRMSGMIGPVDCWQGEDTLRVPSALPPDEAPVLKLTLDTGQPGCM